MEFLCPKCERPTGLLRSTCRHCSFPLTVGSLLGHYFGQVKSLAAIRCPHCQTAVTVGSSVCANCGTALTLGLAIDHTLAPPKRWWRRFLERATPGRKRLIQWFHFLLSLTLLGGMIAHIEQNAGDAWFKYAALSAVYIAVFGLLLLLLVPRRVFWMVYFRSSALTKLSILCNALVATFALQLFIGAWWARAIILASMLGVLWFAAYLFHVYILPMAAATEQTFVGSPQDNFDPRAPQGRNVRMD